MLTHVKARFCNGALVPLEPLDLEEGQEVRVSVEDTHVEGSGGESGVKSGLSAVVEMIDELRESYPSDMWEGLPTDLAKNKKHYLYGHPKEEE